MTTEICLTGVPETMLWALHNRALEAQRPDSIIDDNKAVSIYHSINYDFDRNFGTGDSSHAIRSIDFDRQINQFLHTHPDGVIVNLGEGLETQRFRITQPYHCWVSVDLPEAIALREQFIQPDSKHKHVAMSALDTRWFDQIPQGKPVFITAQGLLMYFTERQIKTLLKAIQSTFSHWHLLFDTIPAWLALQSQTSFGWATSMAYKAPPMAWGINRNDIKLTLSRWLAATVQITDLGYSSFPSGWARWMMQPFALFPYLNNYLPTVVRLDSQPAEPAPCRPNLPSHTATHY